MWCRRTPPRRHARRTVEEVATAQPGWSVTWAGRVVVGVADQDLPAAVGAGAGGGDVAAELDEDADADRLGRAACHQVGRAGLRGGAEVELDAGGSSSLSPYRWTCRQPGTWWTRLDRCAVGRQQLDAAVVAERPDDATDRRVDQAGARLGGVERGADQVGQHRREPVAARGEAGDLGVRAEARAGALHLVQPGPHDLHDRPERGRVGDHDRAGRAPQVEAVRRLPWRPCQEPLVVACGVVLLGRGDRAGLVRRGLVRRGWCSTSCCRRPPRRRRASRWSSEPVVSRRWSGSRERRWRCWCWRGHAQPHGGTEGAEDAESGQAGLEAPAALDVCHGFTVRRGPVPSL